VADLASANPVRLWSFFVQQQQQQQQQQQVLAAVTGSGNMCTSLGDGRLQMTAWSCGLCKAKLAPASNVCM
jgi:hypothetical protein